MRTLTHRRSLLTSMLCLAVLVLAEMPAFAQANERGASGLPLPRFVSIKADKVNMRVGPGIDYEIAWRYMRSDVPMEIIQEYDNWRKVRDAEGSVGWIHHALLSGERTAIVAPWMEENEDVLIDLRSEPGGNGRLIAQLRPGVVLSIGSCDGDWCRGTVDGLEGFVSQRDLWGAYPGEAFH